MTKILKARPPVMYRWLRRRRYLTHALLLACAILFLPLGFAGGVKISHMMTTGKALAATRAMSAEYDVLVEMSKTERARYAAALSDIVIAKPAKMGQLVAPDFLVMLGKPDLKRIEGGLSIWQYRADSCVLDVFFREDGKSGSVIHYEARARQVAHFAGKGDDEGEADMPQCIKSLYKSRNV